MEKPAHNPSEWLEPDPEQTAFRGDGFVRFFCPACTSRLKVPVKYGGRPTQCVGCKGVVRVPAEPGAAAPQKQELSSAPTPRPAPAPEPEPDPLSIFDDVPAPAHEEAPPAVSQAASKAPAPEAGVPVDEYDLLTALDGGHDAKPVAIAAPEAPSIACPQCGKACRKEAVICMGCGQALKAGGAAQVSAVHQAADDGEEGEFKLNGADKGQLISALVVSSVCAGILVAIWLAIAWVTHQQWGGIAALMGFAVGGAVHASIRNRQPLFGLMAAGISVTAFFTAKLLLAVMLGGLGGSLADRVRQAYQDDAIAAEMAWHEAYSPAVAGWYGRAEPKAHYEERMQVMKEVDAKVDMRVNTGEKDQFMDKAIASSPEFAAWTGEVAAYKAKMTEEEIRQVENRNTQLQRVLEVVREETGPLRYLHCMDFLWIALMVLVSYAMAGKTWIKG